MQQYPKVFIPKQIKQIIVQSKLKRPYFSIVKTPFNPNNSQIILKVLYFSIDPVMRVWLSGAKTNFKQCKIGDIFNCFGLAKVIRMKQEVKQNNQISKQENKNDQFKQGDYVFGNTGTTQYLILTQQKKKQLFVVPNDLIKKCGQKNFLYLFNNGIAAYGGVSYIDPKLSQTILVSTAAGATGLLVCQLLLKKGINVIGLTSKGKIQHLNKIFPSIKIQNILDYRTDKNILSKYFQKNHFQGYFDNVGQNLLDYVLQKIDQKGRISLCGAISNYQSYNNPLRGLSNFQLVTKKRLSLFGVNFQELVPNAFEIFQAFQDCKLIVKTIKIEEFPEYFSKILQSGGQIIGKVIVQI